MTSGGLFYALTARPLGHHGSSQIVKPETLGSQFHSRIDTTGPLIESR